MNPSNAAQEETKTIKYINKRNQNNSEKDQLEYPTQNAYAKQIASLSQGNRSSKHSKQHTERGTARRKGLEKQPTKKSKDQISSNIRLQNNQHKKGKSVDLQQMLANNKRDKKPNGQNQTSKQKYKKYASNEINGGFRDRNSISEMKNYNYQSKKHSNTKKLGFAAEHNKRKKPKTINEGDYKQIQRQLKKIIDQTSIHLKVKKKNSSKLTQKPAHNQSCSLNNDKNLKKASKSEELLAQADQRRNKKASLDKNKYFFQKQSFSMPLTEKIITLFSDPSSIYHSRKDLDVINNSKTFIIPTQESVQQIYEIRQYQHFRLRKKNSDSLRQLKKLSPLRQKNAEELCEDNDSTLNIVKLYLARFQDMHEHSLSRELQQISFIPEITKQKSQNVQSQMIDSLNLAQIHKLYEADSIKVQNSDIKLPQTSILLKQQQDIDKLDGLIKQLEKSEVGNLQEIDKQLFLKKIKQLIETSSQSNPKPLNVQKTQTNQINSSNDLKNSELKQSLKQDQNISQLNLQVLDKALRQRQNYLIERKEKQLFRLQEQKQIYGKDEKTSIMKWIEHQIKQVVHTRHQLWKGFYLAKHILKDPSIDKTNEKKKKMMKCLSDKYIKSQHSKSLSNRTEKLASKTKIENVIKETKKEQLSIGRVTEIIKNRKKKFIQSDEEDFNVRVSSEDNDSDQLLIRSQNKKQSCLNQFLEEKEESCLVTQQNQVKKKNFINGNEEDLKKAVNLQSIITKQLQISQPVGLKLLQVQCELEQQSSYNQQQLNELVKESQKAKQESLNKSFNLTVQDKEDIFQFIFLDLCIQLTDQYKNDSPILRKIYSFIKGIKEQSKKQKGFKTNSNAIKQYLYELVSFLKTKNQLLQQIYTNLDKPLGPTALDILKYMHVYDEEPMQEQINESVFIMDLKVFQMFQNVYLPKLEFESYYPDEEKEKKRRTFLKNAIHIHNKAVFDALNQNLDKQRPYGVWGEPFQWKKTPKFYHQRAPLAKSNLISKCVQKAVESSAYMCGFMVDKEDCSFKGNANITQSYIDQIRDDRLSRMLANELQEGQQKMLFIDDEQTQILVEVGLALFQSLLTEAAREFLNLL